MRLVRVILNTRFIIRRKDEFGNLAKAFNHMSDELWIKNFMKESFGKYVGHEILEMILKSPEIEVA
jgi:adenylate cyclase